MEEVKRFMRYVLPGLAVVTEVLLACWATNPCNEMFKLERFKELDGLGVLLAVFLATGALGYFFSTLYYFLQSFPVLDKIFFYNHYPAIRYLKKCGICSFQNFNGSHIDVDLANARPREVWEDFNMCWHMLRGQTKRLEKVEGVLNRLLDILHGHGAHFVGSIIGLLFWCLSWWEFEDNVSGLSGWKLLLFWLAFLVILGMLFKKTKNTIERIQNSVLVTVLRNGLKVKPYKTVVCLTREKS